MNISVIVEPAAEDDADNIIRLRAGLSDEAAAQSAPLVFIRQGNLDGVELVASLSGAIQRSLKGENFGPCVVRSSVPVLLRVPYLSVASGILHAPQEKTYRNGVLTRTSYGIGKALYNCQNDCVLRGLGINELTLLTNFGWRDISILGLDANGERTAYRQGLPAELVAEYKAQLGDPNANLHDFVGIKFFTDGSHAYKLFDQNLPAIPQLPQSAATVYVSRWLGRSGSTEVYFRCDYQEFLQFAAANNYTIATLDGDERPDSIYSLVFDPVTLVVSEVKQYWHSNYYTYTTVMPLLNVAQEDIDAAVEMAARAYEIFVSLEDGMLVVGEIPTTVLGD